MARKYTRGKGVPPMRPRRVRPTRSRNHSMPSSASGKSLFAVDVEFRPAASTTTTHEDADNTPFFDPVNPGFTFSTAAAPPQTTTPTRRGFVLDMSEKHKISGESAKVEFVQKDGATFLDKPYGNQFLSKNRTDRFSSINEAAKAAANEIRDLAKAYYSNYNNLQHLKLMLPEAGVWFRSDKSSKKYFYTHIIVGRVEVEIVSMQELISGTTPFEAFDTNQIPKELNLVGRLHMHWTDTIPSAADTSNARNQLNDWKAFEIDELHIWVASWDQEKPYMTWQRTQ